MKKRAKILLIGSALLFGTVTLSGCTVSFCSPNDQGNIMYTFDDGVTRFAETQLDETYVKDDYYTNLWYSVSLSYNNGSLGAIYDTCNKNGIEVPSLEYWAALDRVFLTTEFSNKDITLDDLNSNIHLYGYKKFVSNNEQPTMWDNWTIYNAKAAAIVGDISKCPTNDFINQYKTSMNNYVTPYRACIATESGEYGNYGLNEKSPVYIESKSYSYGWGRGFLEGLLIWPIGAFTDVLCNAFRGAGTGLNGSVGWAQILAITIVTIIVRLIMFLVSFKSTMANAKMTELQPEIAKIQNKYPNANTNQNEKMRMSQEMSKLYKKNGINPFSTIIITIIQFPIFICVWGALSGSAWLSTGSFLNLNLNESISSALFNGANWGTGAAETALVLFLLMAAAQVVSMLLPQWYQKKKRKEVANLGKNPNVKSQDNKMKWFTYIMMAMIILMGFSLASAMGVYWLVGALFTIIQTIVTQKITEKRQLKEKKY